MAINVNHRPSAVNGLVAGSTYRVLNQGRAPVRVMPASSAPDASDAARILPASVNGEYPETGTRLGVGEALYLLVPHGSGTLWIDQDPI